MLYVPVGSNSFGKVEQTVTTRPANNMGTAITPGSSTKGSYAEIIASTSYDTYGMLININSSGANTVSRNYAMDIAVGAASSEIILIADILCGNSATFTTSNGIWYYFPIFIPAGSRISARASGTVTTAFRTFLQLLQQPPNPSQIRKASFTETLGMVGAQTGTAVVPGTTSLGSWTSIGTTTKDLWWWQIGFQVNSTDTAHIGAALSFDLAVGNGSTYDIIIKDMIVSTSSTEATTNPPISAGTEYRVPGGSTMYIRGWSSAGLDTYNMCVYGAGG